LNQNSDTNNHIVNFLINEQQGNFYQILSKRESTNVYKPIDYTGATGVTGPEGATGVPGPEGATGVTGPQGNPGIFFLFFSQVILFI